jgi:hypothetical protein|tara:strand:- start:3 stop:248 length:246 start_codon:yes stop_codon:yes gene_type:complete
MATQNITIRSITTSPTTLSNLNSISVLNGSASDTLTIGVDGSGQTITLKSGESVSLQAQTGFVLPDLVLTGTSLTAQVITT